MQLGTQAATNEEKNTVESSRALLGLLLSLSLRLRLRWQKKKSLVSRRQEASKKQEDAVSDNIADEAHSRENQITVCHEGTSPSVHDRHAAA